MHAYYFVKQKQKQKPEHRWLCLIAWADSQLILRLTFPVHENKQKLSSSSLLPRRGRPPRKVCQATPGVQ